MVLGICNWQQTMDGSRDDRVFGNCDGQEIMVDFGPHPASPLKMRIFIFQTLRAFRGVVPIPHQGVKPA